MKIGDQIANLRLASHMTQEELAEKIGVSRQAVTKWEASVSIPDLEKIVRLADLFGVSMDKLVGRGDTMYDVVKDTITSLSSSHVKSDEFNFLPIAYRYITFMERLEIPPETVMQGLREMCREAEKDTMRGE